MRFVQQKLAIYWCAAFLILSTLESGAFALLGPVQPWMQATNGVIFPEDIGGPMSISNGYRWNVLVVTYGFDPSFLNYFGSKGVAVVGHAIQMLSYLPPASQMVLADYPLISQRETHSATAQSLYDLESQTLSLLLEQLGLAQPTRNIFVLKQWIPAFNFDRDEENWAGWANPDYIVRRNFNPQTLAPTPYVNQTRYTGSVFSDSSRNYMSIYSANQAVYPNTSVADFNLGIGIYYSELTYDDVGGLAFLYSTNNVNYETLISGVVGVGTNANSFVNGAWRPGVDKITFIPQPVDAQSGVFLPTTNYFTDSYVTNGILMQQQMARVIAQPDFLFSAGDLGSGRLRTPLYTRTGTTNWLNNATANGNLNGAGPGVIQPQVQIVFNKLGRRLYSQGDIFYNSSQNWGSFDGSTNSPVVYPIPQTGTNQMVVRMWLASEAAFQNSGAAFQNEFVWKPSSLSGAHFAMQSSANLTNWTTLFTVTNNGSVTTFMDVNPASANRFYRLIPSE